MRALIRELRPGEESIEDRFGHLHVDTPQSNRLGYGGFSHCLRCDKNFTLPLDKYERELCSGLDDRAKK